MDTRVLLLEGKTDVGFFVPILKRIYGFEEDKSYNDLIPIGKHRNKRSDLSYPIPLVRDNVLLIVYHSGGKDNLRKSLKSLLKSALSRWDDLSIIAVARDVDTNENVMNWTKSILGEFSPRVTGSSLLVTSTDHRVKVIPFAVGDLEFENPHIETKRELELLLTVLTDRESTLTKFSRSIESLKNDKGSKLTPKDVMHVLAIAKSFNGDSMSGLYKEFLERLIWDKKDLIISLLNESGLSAFLDEVTR